VNGNTAPGSSSTTVSNRWRSSRSIFVKLEMFTVSRTDRIFILAGAGVSAESEIPTFRGVGGLSRNYRIEEVASPEAWHRDPRLV
jgi:NAD-dependent SIR2 family protein deacetylase